MPYLSTGLPLRLFSASVNCWSPLISFQTSFILLDPLPVFPLQNARFDIRIVQGEGDGEKNMLAHWHSIPPTLGAALSKVDYVTLYGMG